MKTKALIIVFAEPVDEEVAERMLAELEQDDGVAGWPRFHVEHFTERRAKALMEE